MYSKIRTLSEHITLANTSIDIPRDAVIDSIIMKGEITVENAGATPFSASMETVLKCLEEIRLVSDGSNVNYALNALDVALLNRFDSRYGGVDIFSEGALEVAATSSETVEFTLILNEGDILAVTKDSLELKTAWNAAIGGGSYPDVSITAADIMVSITENVYTPEEFVNEYGPNLEYAAEPKVYALTATIGANTELTGIIDLPTGTLQRRGFLQFSDTSGILGGATPTRVGLIVTSPDRREMLNVDYDTLQAIHAYEFCMGGSSYPGCCVLDYSQKVAADGFGLRGWRWTKGDYQVAVKTADAGKLRYVSCEHVVNTKAFEAGMAALLEARSGV